MEEKIKQKTGQYLSEIEKQEMIQDYLSSGSTKSEIWKKNTGQKDPSTLIKWILKLGY
jgi:transposase-like protein